MTVGELIAKLSRVDDLNIQVKSGNGQGDLMCAEHGNEHDEDAVFLYFSLEQ